MTLDLDIQNPYHFATIPDARQFQSWAEAALQEKSLKGNDFSVVIRIVDEQEGQELNQAYRHKDNPTNVISFLFETPDIPAIDEQTKHLGDLVFCGPLIEKEAMQQEKTIHRHWAHLVVHGMLHLQGYDHIQAQDATSMEALEINIMKQLGFANPYLSAGKTDSER